MASGEKADGATLWAGASAVHAADWAQDRRRVVPRRRSVRPPWAAVLQPPTRRCQQYAQCPDKTSIEWIVFWETRLSLQLLPDVASATRAVLGRPDRAARARPAGGTPQLCVRRSSDKPVGNAVGSVALDETRARSRGRDGPPKACARFLRGDRARRPPFHQPKIDRAQARSCACFVGGGWMSAGVDIAAGAAGIARGVPGGVADHPSQA
jgi:hypothetical protein